MTTAEKIREVLSSPEAVDLRILLAYGIKKTGSLTDDEIADNAQQIANELAMTLSQIHTLAPDEKEATAALIRILETLAAKTSTKWDDRAIKILKMFV